MAKKSQPKKKYVQKPEHGALFKNEDKETDNHPDYKGTYTDSEGEKHWVAAWVNTSAASKKYISFLTTRIDEDLEEDEDEDEEENIPPKKGGKFPKRGKKKLPKEDDEDMPF